MRTYSTLVSGLLLGCGSLISVSSAFAQSAPIAATRHERGHERGHARMEAHREAMHKKLHDALKLSSDQETAWTRFTETTQRPRTPPFDREAMSKLSAPERADKMLEHAQQHQAQMQKHASALKEFYAVLTPEQKKTFDGFHAANRRSAESGRMKHGQDQRGPI